jgi:uncharacterized protein (DUF849 family)
MLRYRTSAHASHFVDRGLIDGPIFIQFVMGVLGGWL